METIHNDILFLHFILAVMDEQSSFVFCSFWQTTAAVNLHDDRARQLARRTAVETDHTATASSPSLHGCHKGSQ